MPLKDIEARRAYDRARGPIRHPRGRGRGYRLGQRRPVEAPAGSNRVSAHGSLVNACIQLINARGGLAWKSQSGRLPVGQRFVYVGKAGLPDVIGVWPWCPALGTKCALRGEYEYHNLHFGRLLAVEVKTGTGRVRRHQEAMHAELRKRGALVVTVRAITDLEKALA